MTIYLDVIWLLNFCTDYLLLMLTGLLLKRKIQKRRIILSSAIASLYVLLIFTPWSAIFYHPVFKFIFSMIVVYIAFRFKRFSYFLQNVAMFYFVAFMIGGGLIAVRFFLQSDSQILNGIASLRTTGFGDPISWIFVIVGFPLLWYFSRGRLNSIEYRSMSYEQIADVEIQIENATIRLKGLIDSGNLLTDPITKAPVMILDCRQTDRSYRLDELISPTSMREAPNHPWSARIRVIPFRSVGHDQQMMVALRPDFINIFHDNQVYKVKHCLVGLSEQQFSSDGDFECILHPKMLIHTNAS